MDTPELARIANDANWLAHRYDSERDCFHFRYTDRAQHAAVTFLTDTYLAPTTPLVLPRAAVRSALKSGPAPIHFIFHSAFCCSTLLARAFDRPGWAMGIKEPVVLNDIAGFRLRGGGEEQTTAALRDALALMGRRFGEGEVNIVKPSNTGNLLAMPMLDLLPEARALLLHAPLRTFLASIARKGMDGRLWARQLFLALLKGGIADLGFDTDRIFEQTDLQIAAMGWLAQHRLFGRIVEHYGADRIRTVDSERLLEEPVTTMTSLAALFGLAATPDMIAAIVDGPAFRRHSKNETAEFDKAQRDAEYRSAHAVHADEIEKVAIWTEHVGRHNGIELQHPAPLLT